MICQINIISKKKYYILTFITFQTKRNLKNTVNQILICKLIKTAKSIYECKLKLKN